MDLGEQAAEPVGQPGRLSGQIVVEPDQHVQLGEGFSAENPLVQAGEVATAVSRRIDYVLVRAGRHGAMLQVLRCDRLLDQPVNGVWASDPYGVVADLAAPSHPPGTWEEDGSPIDR